MIFIVICNLKCEEKVIEFIMYMYVFFFSSEKMSEVTKQLLESYDFEDVRSR